jgi:hypothetical protein
LQAADEELQPLPFEFGDLSGPQEFLLVGSAVAGVEHDGTDQRRFPVATRPDVGGDQHR